MAAQKSKKEFLAEIFVIFKCYKPNLTNQDFQRSSFFHTICQAIRKSKNRNSGKLFSLAQLIKVFNVLDSFKLYGRLLENPKTGALVNYFCLKRIQNLLCKTFDAYRPNKHVKFRPKSLPNSSSTNEVNKLPKSFWIFHK